MRLYIAYRLAVDVLPEVAGCHAEVILNCSVPNLTNDGIMKINHSLSITYYIRK
jgi:hypothetical protein